MTGDDYMLAVRILDMIRFFAFCICSVVWGLVGWFFWIPLLIRASALMSASVLSSLLAGYPMASVEKKMSRSISFYIDGFLIIRRAVYPRESDVHLYGNENPAKMRLGQLLALEAAIAGVIWIVILAFIWAIWIMCNWLLVEM